MMKPSESSKGRTLKRADPSTIQDKFMVGYQGWFTCAGDGEPLDPAHHGWIHWFSSPIPDGGRPNIDLWPDLSEYSPSELYLAPGLKFEDGAQAFLFSSRHPKTVQRHFNWMAQHGVDGAFLQRFAGQTDLEAGNQAIRHLRDEVGDRVREAAELEGRVFAIMYDVSGVPSDRIQLVLERDWAHLVRNKGILDSASYLREKGKPVIALWGFGFEHTRHSPATLRAIVAFFHNNTPGGAYIIAGVPAHWRTSTGDADRNPEFVNVWLNEFDAISPWTVGRYGSEDDADKFAEEKIKGDIELLRKRHEEGAGRKVDYIPVVFPGGSGYNLSEGQWAFNDTKRNGGKFLWRQIFNARRNGVRIMYGAMWDEYDEGTALMPVVETKRLVPKSDRWHFLALDEDGYDLPSDWYMRICGFAAEGLRSERRIHESFPSKELQDYWSSRPRYEDADEDSRAGDAASGSGSASGDGQSYQAWLATQKEDKDEPPPPPYSLEAEETEVVPSQPSSVAPAQESVVHHPSPSSPSTQSRAAPSRSPSGQVYPTAAVATAAVATAASMPTAISSLADAFSRQTISTSGSSSAMPSQPTGQLPFSPPSPANPRTSTTQPTPEARGPHSQGSWSQTQWPPAEWNRNQPGQQQQQQRRYQPPPQHPQNQPGNARPSGMVATQGSYGPGYSSSGPPTSTAGTPPVGHPAPTREPTLSRVYPGEFPPAHMLPSSPPNPTVAGPSYFPGPPQSSSPVPHMQGHGPPITTSFGSPPGAAGPSTYGQPTSPYGPHPVGGLQFPQAQGATYAYSPPPGPPNQPYPSQEQRQPYQQPQQAYPPPQQAYPPAPQPYPQQHQSYQPPSNNPYAVQQGPAIGFPSPNVAPPGPYYGGTQPPPPSNYGAYQPYQPYHQPPPPPPSGTLENVLHSAADTLGLGDNTRRQLDNLAHSGTKLLNKFL